MKSIILTIIVFLNFTTQASPSEEFDAYLLESLTCEHQLSHAYKIQFTNLNNDSPNIFPFGQKITTAASNNFEWSFEANLHLDSPDELETLSNWQEDSPPPKRKSLVKSPDGKWIIRKSISKKLEISFSAEFVSPKKISYSFKQVVQGDVEALTMHFNTTSSQPADFLSRYIRNAVFNCKINRKEVVFSHYCSPADHCEYDL